VNQNWLNKTVHFSWHISCKSCKQLKEYKAWLFVTLWWCWNARGPYMSPETTTAYVAVFLREVSWGIKKYNVQWIIFLGCSQFSWVLFSVLTLSAGHLACTNQLKFSPKGFLLKVICNDFLVVKVNCWSYAYVFNITKSISILRTSNDKKNAEKSV